MLRRCVSPKTMTARLAVETGAPLLMITRTVFDTQDR
jgi:hypothetical protein